jgi:hypothetical protein
MTISELKSQLAALGKRDRFSVRSVAQPEMRPDDVTVVEPEDTGSGWTVYYTERGSVFSKQHFETESAACEYALGIATRPEPSVTASTEADNARARVLAAERERRFRERLAAQRGEDKRSDD